MKEDKSRFQQFKNTVIDDENEDKIIYNILLLNNAYILFFYYKNFEKTFEYYEKFKCNNFRKEFKHKN